MRERLLRNTALSAIAIFTATATPAFAQAQSDSGSESAPGEIVVTAAKRSENLQSVPISVSAIGGDALEKRASPMSTAW